MEDDEEEMAQLRKSKKHKEFEQKFHRDSARIIKQLHLESNNKSQSESPPPKSSLSKSTTKKRKHNQLNDTNTNNTPMTFTEEQINANFPTSFGKKKPIHSPNNNSPNTNHKTNFLSELKSNEHLISNTNTTNNNKNKNTKAKTFEKTTSDYLDYILSEYSIPLKYSAKLKGHTKLISTISIDKSGTRLLSGSYDNSIKFWDFGGMNSELESFRSVTPCEGYPMKQIAYNYTGSMFLSICTNKIPCIYDRDGRLLYSYKSGDMYIRDMNHTFGHTMPLMGGNWFGNNYMKQNVNEFCTYSQDSTFRIWDIESNNGHCKQIIKARNKTGKRIAITAANTNKIEVFNNNYMIVIGCNDGSIQLFDYKSHCKRPKKIIENAHLNGSEISNILMDGNYILTRGGRDDNTMKIWDARNLSNDIPLKVFDNMWNITSLANIIKSPTHKKQLYITTCSTKKDEKIGKSCLCFIDKKSLIEMIRIPVSDKPINNVLWHGKINQIFIGGNDSNVRVFYEDKPVSKNGILLCAKRKYKKKHIDEQVKYFKIINPNAIKVYKKHSQILQEKRKKDLLAHKPEMPHYGIGAQGRINTESFSHNVYRSQEKNVMSQVDPRDRLLLFQDKAEQNQEFTAIYNINQPEPVFQEKNEEELEANAIVNELYKEKPGARQYKGIIEPPKKKQKT